MRPSTEPQGVSPPFPGSTAGSRRAVLFRTTEGPPTLGMSQEGKAKPHFTLRSAGTPATWGCETRSSCLGSLFM